MYRQFTIGCLRLNYSKKKIQFHVWAIPTLISTTKDVICCSNGYIYHFFDYIMLLHFVNANVIHHVQEHAAFVGENAKGAHG